MWGLWAAGRVWEPELRGPYATDEERLNAARALAADGSDDEHSIFRLDASGPVEVSSFSGREISGPQSVR